MARVSRADVNMPDYNGFPLAWLHNQAEFEAAVHHLLEGSTEIPISRLLYFRHAMQSEGPRTSSQEISVDEKSCFLTCQRGIFLPGIN